MTESEKRTIVLHNAVVSDFARFLNPMVPNIWILDHCPNPVTEWYSAEVPIAIDCMQNLQVRQLRYDLQIGTSEFLSKIELFNDFGIDLIQSRKPMPDTLTCSNMTEHAWNMACIQNGAVAKLHLPHSCETGVFAWLTDNHRYDSQQVDAEGPADVGTLTLEFGQRLHDD